MAFFQSSSAGYQSTTGGSGTPEQTETVRLSISRAVDEFHDRKAGSKSLAVKEARKGVTPEVRTKIRSRWRASCEAADGLVRSAAADHADCLFFADELKERLAELWALREYREEDWVGILDRAQSMLGQLDDQTIESIGLTKAKVIRDLVTNFLSPSTKSEHDLREAVRLVSDLDVPPFGDLAALASDE